MFTVTPISAVFPIFHVVEPDRTRLAFAFLRMQEHYESPAFKDAVFTHDEYEAWYVTTYGTYSYDTDWEGFNVPSHTIRSFLKYFPDHTPLEQELLDVLFQNGLFARRRFYLIGTRDDAICTVKHEICHALYHLSREYRDIAQKITTRYDLQPVREFLLEVPRYHMSVVEDELQAYAMTRWPQGAPNTTAMRAYQRELRTHLLPYLTLCAA